MINDIQDIRQYHRVNANLFFQDIQPDINSAVYELKSHIKGSLVDSLAASTSLESPVFEVRDRLRCFVACTALAAYVATNQFSIGKGGNISVDQQDGKAVKLWEINKQVNELKSKAESALSDAVEMMLASPGEFTGLLESRCYTASVGLIFRTAQDYDQYQSIKASYLRFARLTGRLRSLQVQRLLPMMGQTLINNLADPSSTGNVSINTLRELCKAALAPLAYSEALASNLFRLDDVANRPALDGTDANRELSTDKALALAITSAREIGEQGLRAVQAFLNVTPNIPGYAPVQAQPDFVNSDSPIFKL